MAKMTEAYVGKPSALADKKLAPMPAEPKVMMHMMVRPAENGGVSVEHHFGGMHEPEVHAFGPGEHAKALDHIGSHLGMKGAASPVKSDDEEQPE